MNKSQLGWAKTIRGQDFENFHIVEFIDNGKKGVVYKAYEKELPSRYVALKITFGSLPEGWNVELEKVSKLERVNGVVQLHHLGCDKVLRYNGKEEKVNFTSWQLIEPGINLKKYLEQNNSIEVSFYIAVIERVLSVLNAVNVLGVKRHGDLHEGNILIGPPDLTDLENVGDGGQTIFVSDFGYGTSDGDKKPKDDFEGLATIAQKMGAKIDWDTSIGEDRELFSKVSGLLSKCVGETNFQERQNPFDLYRQIQEIKNLIRSPAKANDSSSAFQNFKIGYFQSSEMFGDNWARWKNLFVANIPARSQILDNGITSVLTGPRGCGKTTLFRRMSARLVLECGGIEEFDESSFLGFYINSNDIADAFSSLPNGDLSQEMVIQITAFFNLCFLADFVASLSALQERNREPSIDLLKQIHKLLVADDDTRPSVSGENCISRIRTQIEKTKRLFLLNHNEAVQISSGEIGHHNWLENFIKDKIRKHCFWSHGKDIYLFVDDYTLPRIPPSMQKVINRILLRRTDQYLVKIATEAVTTFVPTDTSQKSFQINEDYSFIDLGGESLAMKQGEREKFLDEIFHLRLRYDGRIDESISSLEDLLGNLGISQNEFAMKIHRSGGNPAYHGKEVFVGMWSGDTRTMVQLMQELVDEAGDGDLNPISKTVQNKVYIEKGAQWVSDLRNCYPTDLQYVQKVLANEEDIPPKFNGFAQGGYGYHLKAVVEAFKRRAGIEIKKEIYIQEGNEIARSAFRLEIFDTFRLSRLAYLIYSDLIRYGIFLRDERGRSTRGAVVPRLYLRRLALPFCTIAITKKNCISMPCSEFEGLLLDPDSYAQKREKKFEDQYGLELDKGFKVLDE